MKALPLLALLTLAACGPAPKDKAETAPSSATTPKFDTSMPLVEVMAHGMNPAAFQFWDGWGTVTNASGEHDLTPKTDAEWKHVEDGAATVVMLTNVLKLPGYAREPYGPWYAYADKAAEVARRGKDAAENKDKDAIGRIGIELDEACEACHKVYIANYK